MSSVALFTSVTGLLAHQRRLDVVANNIANVNTHGYRGSRMVFQDLMYQTLSGGSGAVATLGGTNPAQVGLGVQIGSIDTNFSEGALLNTGFNSDMAIQGGGFFVLEDGSGLSYTRDGSFQLNPDGTLIDPATGRRVQGWLADDLGDIDTELPIGDIEIPIGGAGVARGTTSATLVGNLEAGSPVGETVNATMEVFDSLGTSRQVTLAFEKQAAPENTWNWTATFEGDEVGSGALTFSNTGALPNGTTGDVSIPAASLTIEGAQPADLNFTLDFDAISQISVDEITESEVFVQSQDGYPLGTLESFNVGDNGQIIGVFSNNLRRPIAQVALANFSNVGGLSREGDNRFVETTSSGIAQIGPAGSGGRGTVSGGVLESSNVDLGTEFSNLILTQRGFQANSRGITAADTLLQETVNLVR